MCVLKNPVQEYAWGSRRAIPELLGKPAPAERPQAELWMGAHPKAPSQVFWDGAWRSLLELIQEYPEDILGEYVATRFCGRLPFLFKVLAADKPLSIQAHPSLRQAQEGFAREKKRGIPLDSPYRNYKDDNHKPEIICALTPFCALVGFRKINDILMMMDRVCPRTLAAELEEFRGQPNREGLKRFFNALMTMEKDMQVRVVAEAVSFAKKVSRDHPVFEWMIKLNMAYPSDIGVLSPILLNLILLRPNEAIYIPAGELHAYLGGVGIELMANSDNVMRGGLTPKHVDVPELLRILTFEESQVSVLTPRTYRSGESVYPTCAEEFVLSVISVREGNSFISGRDRSVEMMICTRGGACITDMRGGDVISLTRGTAVLVPAAVQQYRIDGDAVIHKAAVPA
nr:mannose-6-phosphate isomerase, class I [Desulfobacterales bacterium]